MGKLKVRQIRLIRDDMEPILVRGTGLKRRDLIEKLLLLPQYKSWNCDSLYPLVCLAVNTYDRDFYEDPSTREIFLTRGRLEQMLNKGNAGRDAGATRSGRPPIVGITAAGRIGEALEAAEG